ncbi:MAG: hypothetical protein CUN53_03055 [Phototrophicales bacterium]|nr:MAG: hypothetical protein CUN53_03055 [Phototrophicales bacterium]
MLKLLLLVGLAACAPTPTPLPVIIQSTTAPTPSDTADARIAVDPLYAEYAAYHGGFSDDVEVTVVSDAGFWSGPPDTLNNIADAAFALGVDVPDRQLGTEINWVLRIGSEAGSSDLSSVLREAFSPSTDQAVLRARLANLGYPDGLTLTAAEAAPESAFMDAPLNVINLRTRRIPSSYDSLGALLENGQAQIALIALPSTLLHETDLIVASRTIQYRAAPGVMINFTERGLPIVTVS